MSFKSKAEARAAGAKGGAVRAENARAARLRPDAYGADFLTFRAAVGRGGPTRELWTVFWRAVDGLPLDAQQLALFQRHTGRQQAPTVPAREVWVPAGRRSGKSENAMLRATWRCMSRTWSATLSPGEVGTVPVIASDKDQARNSLHYLKGLAKHPLVAPYVAAIKRDAVLFRTGAEVRVVTASWRATHGYTFCDVVLEECAFYQDESGAEADVEILAAVRPGLLTAPDARVLAISSPYARRGILHAAVQEHWGRDGDDVLVFNASTEAFNPTVPTATIRRAFAEDAARAASEYGSEGLVQFRADVSSLFDLAVLRSCVVPGRHELPPAGVRYVAFTDPSGGSADSFTLAIAHAEDGRAVLDLLRERRPPFSPDAVVEEFAETLRAYALNEVVSDRYAGEWPRERWAAHGISFAASPQSKSELYLALLPSLNAARVELLDLPRLLGQLAQLERRTARGTGKDVVGHPPGAGSHDDLANAVAGACVLAFSGLGGGTFDAAEAFAGANLALRRASPVRDVGGSWRQAMETAAGDPEGELLGPDDPGNVAPNWPS